jgi:hypothetical protein
MTNKELQKTMEFIIERQEVFADNMDKLSQNMDKADKRIGRLERGFVAVFDLVNETAKLQKDLTQSHAELRDAQKHTDDKLNILIDVVERFISEKPNGRSRNGRRRQTRKRNGRG